MKHEISRFMQQHIQRRLIKQMRERKRYVFHIQLTHLGYVIYYKIPSKNSHIALKLHMYPNIHIKSKKLIWVQATGFNSTCFSFLITLLSRRSFQRTQSFQQQTTNVNYGIPIYLCPQITTFLNHIIISKFSFKHAVFNGLNFLCLPSHIERREDT